MEAKVGDFILTKDKVVYVIIDKKYTFGIAIYDIKSLKKQPLIENIPTHLVNTAWYDQSIWQHRVIKEIAHNKLKHVGKLIPAEQFSAALEILYK